jgi:hypothetical protein
VKEALLDEGATHASLTIEITMPVTRTSITRGVEVAEKSPNQHNVKKVGKSLKEKRNEKHNKKESKKGIQGT